MLREHEPQLSVFTAFSSWSIKDLSYGFWRNFACGIQRVVPSGHRSGSQSRRAIWFILPARGAGHIIIPDNANMSVIQDVATLFSILQNVTGASGQVS